MHSLREIARKYLALFNHIKYYNMAQESNKVNIDTLTEKGSGGIEFKVTHIVIQDKDLLLSILMNERDFVLTIDKESFDDWFSDGTGIISWAIKPPELDGHIENSNAPISDWWNEMVHNDTAHLNAVKMFIEKDLYPLGMLKAQYLYDSILYDDMSQETLTKSLWAFQEQIRLCTMLWSNRQFTKENGFKYTKEIKIC